MARGLTRKQKIFVKGVVEGKTQTAAALEAYDTDYNTARSIGTENLTKPAIVKAIHEALPDDLLATKHLALLNKLDERGEIDVQAVKSGLDMAYKIKGSYAPEKRTSLNVNIGGQKEDKDGLEAIRQEYIQKLKEKLSES